MNISVWAHPRGQVAIVFFRIASGSVKCRYFLFVPMSPVLQYYSEWSLLGPLTIRLAFEWWR